MINRLAHVEVGVRDLDLAREFYVDLLGFEESLRSDQALYLRAAYEYDQWSLKLTKSAAGAGMLSAGFRVHAPEDLERLDAIHERLGIASVPLSAGFHPGRGTGLRVKAPSDHVLDFHFEIDEAELPAHRIGPVPPMRRVEASRGVPPTELDHINTRAINVKEAVEYWTEVLGFSVGELVARPDGSPQAAWMRCTRTTHDVACGPWPQPGLHHFAYSVADGQSLLRTADLLGDAGHASALQFGPARHGATNALTMYFLDPDGNRIELFCGDYHRDLDRAPNIWTTDGFDEGGRFWWGVEPKPEFQLPTPLLAAPWPQAVAVAEA
jgi:catechol 2,3-dioxygenase